MTVTYLDRLLSVSSPLSQGQDRIEPVTITGPLGQELQDLLRRSNGLYAFESALHVFGTTGEAKAPSLAAWNADDGWRADYRELATGCLFFAEDAFGGQFAMKEGGIYTFDPETGGCEVMASSLEEWAYRLITDYPVLTGYPVAHEWQELHGPLKAGERLVPKRPFVLGGEFAPDNLYPLEAAEGMRVRADLAQQLRTLPDGAKVRYRVVKK